jgi:hypothetical protein
MLIWNTWRSIRRSVCELTGGHKFRETAGLKKGDKWVSCYIECSRCGRLVDIDKPNASDK